MSLAAGRVEEAPIADVATLKIVKDVAGNMEAFVLMAYFEQILNPVYSPFPHHSRALCLESSRKEINVLS